MNDETIIRLSGNWTAFREPIRYLANEIGRHTPNVVIDITNAQIDSTFVAEVISYAAGNQGRLIILPPSEIFEIYSRNVDFKKLGIEIQ